MTTITSNAFTLDDPETRVHDGKRYELIGGALAAAPPRAPVHRGTGQRLVRLLEDACPLGCDTVGPVDLDLPAPVCFSVGALARRRAE